MAPSFAAAAICLLLTISAKAQTPKTRPAPRFEDFPAALFTGVPAAPVFVHKNHSTFRTRIREGVSKGIGVAHEDGREGSGPNFGGRYITVEIMCGSPCILMAIVDAQTGQIFDPPTGFVATEYRFGRPLYDGASFEFHRNSRLFKVSGCYEVKNACVTSYYVREPGEWKLIHREPFQKKTDW